MLALISYDLWTLIGIITFIISIFGLISTTIRFIMLIKKENIQVGKIDEFIVSTKQKRFRPSK